MRIDGTVTTRPTNKACVGERDRMILECTVNVVDTKLVVYEEIDRHRFIVPPPRPMAGQLHEIRAERRKRVQDFLATRHGTDKETFEKSGSDKGKGSPVNPSHRLKTGNNLLSGFSSL